MPATDNTLERLIRRNVLLTLLAELYERKLSDVIAVKEWLQTKLEEEPRCTNHYLCPKDDTRWDAGWSCMANDRCPTCDDVVQPYATSRTEDGGQTIHDQAVYDRANGVGQ